MSDWLPVWDWTLKNISTLIAILAIFPALLAALFAWRSSDIAKKSLEKSQNLEIYQLVHKTLIGAYAHIDACDSLKAKIAYVETNKYRIKNYKSASDALDKHFKTLRALADCHLELRTCSEEFISKGKEEFIDVRKPEEKIRDLIMKHSEIYHLTLSVKNVQEKVIHTQGMIDTAVADLGKLADEIRDGELQLAISEAKYQVFRGNGAKQ